MIETILNMNKCTQIVGIEPQKTKINLAFTCKNLIQQQKPVLFINP